MKPFVFFKQHRPEEVPSFEIEMFDALEPALAYGRRLLLRDMLLTEVLVTEGGEAEIARLSRRDLTTH